MRTIVDDQVSLVPHPIAHAHGAVLDVVARILDIALEAVGALVHADLVRGLDNPGRGRRGMSASEVVHALIIKQMNGFSYEELAYLADSSSYRRLMGYGVGDRAPSAKTRPGSTAP